MRSKKFGGLLVFVLVVALFLSACDNERKETVSASTSNVDILFYTNDGRNYNTIHATGTVKLTPNSYREWGYDSDGCWSSQWATSSVITINANGHVDRVCGNTIVVKDAELELVTDDFKEWLTRREVGKVVILMSQDGSKVIGLMGGDTVVDSVSEDLPKSTVLYIDGKQALIHRANYEIIDRELLDVELLAVASE